LERINAETERCYSGPPDVGEKLAYWKVAARGPEVGFTDITPD